MQYIVVLFLMIGIAVFLVAAVLGISYGLGALLRAKASPAGGSDPAARFEADREWYEDLPLWQRNAVIVWWLANRYLCRLHERGELPAPKAGMAAPMPQRGAPARRV